MKTREKHRKQGQTREKQWTKGETDKNKENKKNRRERGKHRYGNNFFIPDKLWRLT